jgi:hypothetical protein
MHHQPKYPIFMPSKARWHNTLTAKALVRDKVDFTLVVEPDEFVDYARVWADKPGVSILKLPFEDKGLHTTRAWIKTYVQQNYPQAERHWQIDDNIRYFGYRWQAKRWWCNGGVTLRAIEHYTDLYQNVAVSGPNYYMFVPDHTKYPPFSINCHVYSCSLILNNTPYTWRIPLNDDVDYCLQHLATGYNTILIHAFLQQKVRTMMVKGGMTDEWYKKRDGRLKMARMLQRMWPGVVEVERRFARPQHVVAGQWKLFDTPLRLKPEYEGGNIPVFDLPFELKQVGTTIRSEYVKEMLNEWQETHTTA